MYAARGKAAADAFLRNETLAGVQERPLGERASELPGTAPRGATRHVLGKTDPRPFHCMPRESRVIALVSAAL